MVLKQLIEIQKSGALEVEYEKGSTTGYVGGQRVTKEQADNVCKSLGWEGYVLSPFEIIDKTKKFVKQLGNNMRVLLKEEGLDEDTIFERITIEFINKHSGVYGKTCDRIHIKDNGIIDVSVVYNMEGSAAKYMVYDIKTSTPLEKCRNVKKVAEYLVREERENRVVEVAGEKKEVRKVSKVKAIEEEEEDEPLTAEEMEEMMKKIRGEAQTVIDSYEYVKSTNFKEKQTV